MTRFARIGCSLVPLAVGFTVFARSLGYPLVWDDIALVDRVHGLLQEGGWARVLAAEFRLSDELSLGYYRPVVLASLALDDLAWRGGLWTFHATNVVLHLIATWLVTALLRRLAFSPVIAALGASIFAAHPVHVESVAFVSSRTDLLALIFILVTTLAWLHADGDRLGVRMTWRAAALAAFTLALLSKELAVMLPAVLLLFDVLGIAVDREKAGAWWRRNLAWGAGCLGCIALVGLLRFEFVGVALGGMHRATAVRDLAATDWAPSWIGPILTTYARLLVTPWPLNGYYTPDQTAVGPAAIVSLVMFAAIVLLGVRSTRRPTALAGLVWTLLFLVPVTGIVVIAGAVAAERFLYVPSVGFSVVLCCAVLATARRPWLHRCLISAVMIWCVVLAGMTVARVPVWSDELTLYGNLVVTSPRCVECLENLGIVLSARGRHAEAMEPLVRAIQLRPGAAKAHNMLGIQLAVLGRSLDALPHFAEAARLRPDRAIYFQNQGRALLELRRFEEAERAFRWALERAPEAPGPHLGLGLALVGEGRLAEAERERQFLDGRAGDLALQLANAIRAASQ